jgi:CRP-like cAMP-binding protein
MNPMFTSKESTSPRTSEIQSYLQEHHLEQLYEDMMAALLFYRPEKPLEFMIRVLKTIQKEVDEGTYTPQMHAETFRKHIENLMNPTKEENFLDIKQSPSLSLSAAAAEASTMESIRSFEWSSQAYHSKRRGSVSAESIDPCTDGMLEKTVIPKSDEARIRIALSISKNLLFRNLERDQKKEVVDAMFERKCKSGEKVIVQGDEGDNFYVVDSGLFYVFVEDKKVLEVGPGGSFGELALMYNTPRAATVQAITDAVLWGVDRVTFHRTIMNSMYKKRRTYEAFLRTVPILQTLSSTEIAKVADALETVEYEDRETIIEQGDIGDSFYIIVEGEAIVTKKSFPGSLPEEVGRLKPGNYFGEIALITDRPRAATVSAVGRCRCVSLDTKTFVRLLGSCMDILKRNMEQYKKYERVVRQK